MACNSSLVMRSTGLYAFASFMMVPLLGTVQYTLVASRAMPCAEANVVGTPPHPAIAPDTMVPL